VVDDLDGNAARLRLVEGAGGIAVQGGPGVFVDFRTQRGLERLVGVVGSQEVGVAHEEALLVVIRVDEPAGDALRPIATHFAGVGMHNLAPDSPAIGFEINEGRFAWRGESSVSAGEILAADLQPEERSAREEAAQFLLEALTDGSRPQPEVIKDARALGISEKTLRRAKGDLGVVSTPRYEPGRRGAAGHDWQLPEPVGAGQEHLDGHVSTYGHLGHLNGPESEPTPFHVGVGHVNSASDEEQF